MRRLDWTPVPELVTAPADDPVSLAEAKAQCRVDHDDEDAVILGYVRAAAEWVEVNTERQILTATYRLKLPDFCWWSLELPYPPLRSVGSVQYLDAAGVLRTLASSAYDVVTSCMPGRLQLADGQTWPADVKTHPEAVRVTYECGYGGTDATPRRVKQAILLLVGHWYERREAVSEVALASVPMGVDSLLGTASSYRF
jgi:uncharacterized phiE125 gp8 family phage protein